MRARTLRLDRRTPRVTTWRPHRVRADPPEPGQRPSGATDERRRHRLRREDGHGVRRVVTEAWRRPRRRGDRLLDVSGPSMGPGVLARAVPSAQLRPGDQQARVVGPAECRGLDRQRHRVPLGQAGRSAGRPGILLGRDRLRLQRHLGEHPRRRAAVVPAAVRVRGRDRGDGTGRNRRGDHDPRNQDQNLRRRARLDPQSRRLQGGDQRAEPLSASASLLPGGHRAGGRRADGLRRHRREPASHPVGG